MIPFWPSTRSAQIVAWSLAIALTVLSVVPPDLRPETGVPHYFEHLLAYAAMGTAFGLGYEKNPNTLATYLVCFCAVIEIAQLFVPGRHARLLDFAVDAFGTSLGIVIVSVARAFHRRPTGST